MTRQQPTPVAAYDMPNGLTYIGREARADTGNRIGLKQTLILPTPTHFSKPDVAGRTEHQVGTIKGLYKKIYAQALQEEKLKLEDCDLYTDTCTRWFLGTIEEITEKDSS